jgi:hypothetical protein
MKRLFQKENCYKTLLYFIIKCYFSTREIFEAWITNLFLSPKKNNGLKWVKEIEANQIKQKEKEDSQMGGKQEGEIVATLGSPS